MTGVAEGLWILAVVGSGVVTGTLLIFSNAIMPALERQGPDAGAAAMVAVNEVILNPIFLGLFMGTTVTASAAAGLAVLGGDPGRMWTLAGAMAYVVGVFGITAAVNVPLNDRLADATPGSSEAREFWQVYLDRWVFWNSVRSIAGVVATVLFAMARFA